MRYVALFRGINVGGNNKLNMKELCDAFQKYGFLQAASYINSGNVMFDSKEADAETLAARLEQMVTKEFNLHLRIVVRTNDQIQRLATALPDAWQNNAQMKCDVLFSLPGTTADTIKTQLDIDWHIEDVKYIENDLIWRVDRSNQNKSGLHKSIGSPIYKQLTIRNCNTLRKLALRLDVDAKT